MWKSKMILLVQFHLAQKIFGTIFRFVKRFYCTVLLKVSAIPLHCLRMNLTSQSFVMRKKDYSSDDGLHTKRQQLETWKWRLAPKKSCRQKAEGEVITIWVHPAPWKNGFQNVSMVFSLLLCGEEEGKFFIYHAHQVCYCTSHGLKVLFKLH